MATRNYKLMITLRGVQERHLPDLIKAVRKGGRLLHADAMFILGDNPAPEVLLYGEDLTPDEKEK